MARLSQTPATSLLTNTVDKQHGSITPPDGVEGVRCPFPADPTFSQTVFIQNVSPWQNFVLAQHNRFAVQLSWDCRCGWEAGKRYLASGANVFTLWVSVRSMGALRQESHPSKERKDKRTGGGKVTKCLEENRQFFRMKAQDQIHPKQPRDSTLVRRCNRLRWCLVAALGFQHCVSNRST